MLKSQGGTVPLQPAATALSGGGTPEFEPAFLRRYQNLMMATWDVPVVASRASSTRSSMPKADCTEADALIDGLGEGDILLADKGYDSNAIRSKAAERMAWANIPPKANRKGTITFSPWVYRQKNLVERFFNRIKQFRGSATRYDKRQENYLAAVKLLAARRWYKNRL